MSYYHKKCNVCNQLITMVEDPRYIDVWQPLEPDGSDRRHEHYSGADANLTKIYPDNIYSNQSRYGWSIYHLSKPLTFETKCWYCRRTIYFHTNGYGDIVFFNELGWPWDKHNCTERIMYNGLRSLEDRLHGKGFNGHHYRSTGTLVETPSNRESISVSITGYVSDNFVFYRNSSQFFLGDANNSSATPQVRFEVKGKKEIYPFVIPKPLAYQIPDFTIIKITGRWTNRFKNWHLITTEINWTEYNRPKPYFEKIFTLGEVLLCSNCGEQIEENEAWCLDSSAKVLCENCSAKPGSSH